MGSRVCPSCGAENDENAKFCLKCGAPLNEPEKVSKPETPKTKNCVKCGAELPFDANFCDVCAANQNESQPSEPENGKSDISENLSAAQENVKSAAASAAKAAKEQTKLAKAQAKELKKKAQDEIKAAKGGKKKYLWVPIVAAVVVIAIVVGIFSAVLKGGNSKPTVLFTKNDELNALSYKAKDSTEFSKDYDYDDIIYSDDETKILYFTPNSYNYTLYYQDLSSKGLKNSSVKIDDNVSSDNAMFSGKDNFVYFLNDDDSLYCFNIKTGEKTKLFSDVDSFSVNEKNTTIVFETTDDEICYSEVKTPEKVKIDTGSILKMDWDNSAVVYSKDGSVYKCTPGGTSEKIISDYEGIEQIISSNSIYYTTSEKTEIPYTDLVDDDMLAQDQKDKESGGNSISIDNIAGTTWEAPASYDGESDYYAQKLYISSVSDGKATIQLTTYGYYYYDYDTETYTVDIDNNCTLTYIFEKGTYGSYEETLKLDLSGSTPRLLQDFKVTKSGEYGTEFFGLFNPSGFTLSSVGKKPYEYRDDIRTSLANHNLTITSKSLNYYNGIECNKIADNVSDFVKIDYEKQPVILYKHFDQVSAWKIKMTAIPTTADIYDIESLVGKAKAATSKLYFAVNGNESEFDSKGGSSYSNFALNKDETSLYYIKTTTADTSSSKSSDSDSSSGKSSDSSTVELYKLSISGNEFSDAEKIATDVESFFVSENGNAYYFKDVSDGVGDMYSGDKSVATDVSIDSVSDVPGTKDIAFIYDYSKTSEQGTLAVLKNGEKQKIADDVYDFCAYNESYIAILANYNTNRDYGELKLYNGKKELVTVKSDVEEIIKNDKK